MNYFDILLAKKMGGSAPLPANAYLLTEVTDGDLTSAKSKPLPSVSVAVTDADELDVFVGDSESVTSDNEPYIYRQSKGGRMVSERLVGASVAWNQLVRNGNFADASGWVSPAANDETLVISDGKAIVTILTATLTYLGLKRREITNSQNMSGHVALAAAAVKSSAQTHIGFNVYNSTDGSSQASTTTLVSANTSTNVLSMWKLNQRTQQSDFYIYVNSSRELAVNDTVEVDNVMLFDLTLMFGSTIADYVYSLEQATAGSGIAWLKSYGFFSEDYYAYDSGSLESVSVSEKKVVGFNQWDEEYRVGYYALDGSFRENSSGYMSSKNKIRVLPSTTYNIRIGNGGSGTVYLCQYDATGSFVTRLNMALSDGNKIFTTPSDIFYVNFSTETFYGTTYNNDICINISDPSKNGTYEPYKHTTYPLPSSDLRGLYKLSSDKLRADGDIQYGDGWRLRRYGIVDLGTLTYSYAATWGSNTNLFYTNQLQNDVKHGDTDSYVANAIITGYETTSRDESNGSSADKLFSINSTGQIQIINHSFSSINAFTTAMSGVYLIYELAAPTWEKTNPFTNPQTVGSTEEFVANLPVGHESKYYDGDIHHSYIYAGDARAKVTGDVDIVNGTAPNGTCSVCVVMPDGDEIWSDAGDVTAEIWT